MATLRRAPDVGSVGSRSRPGLATAALPQTPAMVRFEGGGWGHGVGMSQYGAYGRGAAGHDRAEILGFYYPGTDLTTVDPLDDVAVHLFSGFGAVFTTSGPVDLINADDEVFVTLEAATTLTIDRVIEGFTITTPTTPTCVYNRATTTRSSTTAPRARSESRPLPANQSRPMWSASCQSARRATRTSGAR